MRTRRIIGIAVIAAMVLTASVVLAQPWRGWRGSGGWGFNTPFQRLYDTAKVETLAGTVEVVDKITPIEGMLSGIYVALKTEKETVTVILGPEWYIERLDVKIEKGDKIEIKGVKATILGKPAIIASEVKKGDNVLVLRGASGIPAWAGWRR
jgi:hypothetical protein